MTAIRGGSWIGRMCRPRAMMVRALSRATTRLERPGRLGDAAVEWPHWSRYDPQFARRVLPRSWAWHEDLRGNGKRGEPSTQFRRSALLMDVSSHSHAMPPRLQDARVIGVCNQPRAARPAVLTLLFGRRREPVSVEAA